MRPLEASSNQNKALLTIQTSQELQILHMDFASGFGYLTYSTDDLKSQNGSRLSSLKFNKSSAVAEMGDCLATIDMGRKVGGCRDPICRGSWVPI